MAMVAHSLLELATHVRVFKAESLVASELLGKESMQGAVLSWSILAAFCGIQLFWFNKKIHTSFTYR
eukprot:58816-Pelagomonas_calceolata.AAC.1